MAALWNDVQQKLVTYLPSLPGWEGVTLFDGVPLQPGQYTSYATVGWVDGEEAGTFQFEQGPSGFEQVEQGDVRSQLVVQTGNSDIAPVRTQAAALVSAVYDWAAADRTLGGVLPPQSMVSVAGVFDFIKAGQGIAVAVTFALHYYAVH